MIAVLKVQCVFFLAEIPWTPLDFKTAYPKKLTRLGASSGAAAVKRAGVEQPAAATARHAHGASATRVCFTVCTSKQVSTQTGFAVLVFTQMFYTK